MIIIAESGSTATYAIDNLSIISYVTPGSTSGNTVSGVFQFNVYEILGFKLLNRVLQYSRPFNFITLQSAKYVLKVEYQGVELDIVIPDTRTLEKDSKMTLLIIIPKSSDKKIIDGKISQLKKIQPMKENIWIVLSEQMQLDCKSFTLSKNNNTFSKIIFEIAQFSNVGKSNKFKILRI